MLDLREPPGQSVRRDEQDEDVFWAQHDPQVEQCYGGQWVVPLGRRIVAHGTDVEIVIQEAARVSHLSRDGLVACAVPQPNDWLADA